MRQLIARAEGKRVISARAASLAAAAVVAAVLLSYPMAGHATLVRDPVAGQLVVTITDAGLTPAQATAQAGIVHLRVENRVAGEAPVTLRVTKAGGAQVRDISVPARGGEVATELELATGSYTLAVVGQPSLSCQLTVQ